MSDNFTQQDGISLREYVEAILDEKERALQLQSVELSRRLDLLNGEAERLKDMQNTYLPREVADERNEKHNSDIKELQIFRAELNAKASQISVIVSFLVGLTGLILGVIGLLK